MESRTYGFVILDFDRSVQHSQDEDNRELESLAGVDCHDLDGRVLRSQPKWILVVQLLVVDYSPFRDTLSQEFGESTDSEPLRGRLVLECLLQLLEYRDRARVTPWDRVCDDRLGDSQRAILANCLACLRPEKLLHCAVHEACEHRHEGLLLPKLAKFEQLRGEQTVAVDEGRYLAGCEARKESRPKEAVHLLLVAEILEDAEQFVKLGGFLGPVVVLGLLHDARDAVFAQFPCNFVRIVVSAGKNRNVAVSDSVCPSAFLACSPYQDIPRFD